LKGASLKIRLATYVKRKEHLTKMCPIAEDEEDDHDDKVVDAQVARVVVWKATMIISSEQEIYVFVLW
jgi:hypothetical protein